jgi:sugar (pentulose or hexulose) kinase
LLIEVASTSQLIASGGFTQSRLWLQVMADVLHCELSVPVWARRHMAAAFWAALAAGQAHEDIRDWFKSMGLPPGWQQCQSTSESIPCIRGCMRWLPAISKKSRDCRTNWMQ